MACVPGKIILNGFLNTNYITQIGNRMLLTGFKTFSFFVSLYNSHALMKI